MIVGIDLGTTNSAIGVWRDGKVELIPNSLGGVLTPSAVSMDEGGQLLVGLAARERQVTHPTLSATAFKRYMGSQRRTYLGKRSFLPEELSALVLASLKADAERFLGEPVTQAIITVPAYFNDRQRTATRRAGQLAGLTVERLINEPTAAALAYGIHQRDAESRFLVFDLGGGTFDVSIVELFEGIMEVRASTGDNFLGGEDFNAVLIDMFRRKHREALARLANDETSPLFQRIRDQAERCRRQLSSQETASMQVAWEGASHSLEVTSEAFEAACADLIERLRSPVLQSLRDSNVRAESLDEIILVGGATRMPIVRNAVTRMFGRFPALRVNPDEAVAIGAAILGGLKGRDAQLREIVLTDVCPYTLGVEISSRMPSGAIQTGLFSPIIERNTVVPASRERSFRTMADGQQVVELPVYQGESRKVEDNIKLGEIRVPVPPRPAGAVQVVCRFSYDISGILEVDVAVPMTGESRQLVIVDDAQSMGAAEVERRRQALADLKIHPREQDANRALLARLERCFEQSLGEERERIGQWLGIFNQSLEEQNPRQITQHREQLTAALDQFEGSSYL